MTHTFFFFPNQTKAVRCGNEDNYGEIVFPHKPVHLYGNLELSNFLQMCTSVCDQSQNVHSGHKWTEKSLQNILLLPFISKLAKI